MGPFPKTLPPAVGEGALNRGQRRLIEPGRRPQPLRLTLRWNQGDCRNGERGKQARMDLNHDTQDQNLMCYRYTTGLGEV